MYKKITMLAAILFLGFVALSQNKSFHDFQAKTIDGEMFNFSSLKGKKVLVVNTASKCGLTKQYKLLQELYDEYGGDDFTIVGFPSNDFMKQEPGTNGEIKAFCQKNYGVTFLMMEKVPVKGSKAHPVYKWLTQKEQNGVLDAPMKWNFQKFMIDENGKLLERTISSLSSSIRDQKTDRSKEYGQALDALQKARTQIEQISTWPWK